MPLPENLVNHPYRLLDIDDLYILKMIGEGDSYTYISAILGLTPPAISHRLRKYEQIWEGFAAINRNKKIHSLNAVTQEVVLMATQVLEVLNEFEKCGDSDDGDDADIRYAGGGSL